MPDDRRTRQFSLNISFGRKPPVEADSDRVPGQSERMTVELRDGKLLVGTESGVVEGEWPEGDGAAPAKASREAEAWERLANIGNGAYPDTARLHRALNRFVLVVGLAIPVALCALAIASGQTGETTVFMTLGGLIVGMMLITSFPNK